MYAIALILGAVIGLSPHQAPASTNHDLAVYEAILTAKIRPEVDRVSAGAGIRTPAPVLTFDRTLVICGSVPDRPRPMGCIRAEAVQSLETELPWMRNLRFEALLRSATREELAKSFRDRNRDSRPFPGAKLEGLIIVSPENIEEAMKRESSRTKGFSSFGLPAYSSDGHALVYGSYVCGELCGYGWLFLLERSGNSWQVVATEMLWIS